jgi:hypothetical protein
MKRNTLSGKDSTNRNTHKVIMNDKQIEFLIKCIDISQSTLSIKPEKSEVEIIRELSELNEDIQETKLGDTIYYDLN